MPARDTAFQNLEPLIHRLIRAYPPHTREDLQQEARLALLEARARRTRPIDEQEAARIIVAALDALTERASTIGGADLDGFPSSAPTPETHLIERGTPEEPDAAQEAREAYATTIEPHLSRLPPAYREAIELRYRRGWTQAEIGNLLGITQPAVNHRLKVALKALALYSRLPVLTSRDIFRLMKRLEWDRSRTRILASYYRLGSVPRTAKETGVSTSTVRRTIVAAITQLSAHPETVGLRDMLVVLQEKP